MRTLAAGACALLLLALMPAFALLRYEHSVWNRGREEQTGKSLATRAGHSAAQPSSGAVQLGPSLWSEPDGHANAASSVDIAVRSMALAALAEIEDSIPRPAGTPSPKWAALQREASPSARDWHITVVDLLRKCAGATEGPRCRDRDWLTVVSLRVLTSGLNEADVLAEWQITPGTDRGWFRVHLVRTAAGWHASRIGRRPAERAEAPIS